MVLYLHFVLFCIKMFLDNVKSRMCCCGVVFTLCTVVYVDVLGQCEKSYVCCGVVFTLCTVVYVDVLGQCEESDVLLWCCIYTLYCCVFKMFLDNVKSRMCCLSVVVCVWLCSYMNTVVEASRVRPLAMLEHLTNKFKSDPTVQSDR